MWHDCPRCGAEGTIKTTATVDGDGSGATYTEVYVTEIECGCPLTDEQADPMIAQHHEKGDA